MGKILNIINVSKIFDRSEVLSNINLKVSKGEILGLIGTNGAGKSTLLNIIAGIIPTTSGEIIFKDKHITNKKSHQICKYGIAKTSQIPKPFNQLTIFENIYLAAVYGGDYSNNEAKELTNEILNFIRLREISEKFANQLSVPQTKRLELGRALATKPEILLLDENLAGLTPGEVDEVIGIIKDINSKGITIIIVEHIIRAIRQISDRTIVLNFGKIIAEGKTENVLNYKEVQKAYFGE